MAKNIKELYENSKRKRADRNVKFLKNFAPSRKDLIEKEKSKGSLAYRRYKNTGEM